MSKSKVRMASNSGHSFSAALQEKLPGKKIELLPPSVFESHKDTDVWQQLTNAQSEIFLLKKQNQELKEKGNEPEYLNDTAKTQIVRVNSEAQLQQKIAHLESKLILQDAEHKHQQGALQQELQTITLRYSQQLRQKENAHDVLKEAYDRLKESLVQTEEQVKSQQQKYNNELKQIELQKSQIENEFAEQKLQLEKLKRYVSESEDSAKSTQIWNKQTEKLNKHIKNLEEEKGRLESSLQLCNIRLKSQMDIQSLQEEQLAQTGNGEKQTVLLKRWREKVFELMVQLESSDISQKDEKAHWNKLLKSKEHEREKEKKTREVLEHTLTDKKAVAELQVTKIQELESELNKTMLLALQLDESKKESEAHISDLASFAKFVGEKYSNSERLLEELMSKLDSHSRRISFASGRVEMLQSQFARQRALIKVELEQHLKAGVHNTDVDDGTNMSTQMRIDDMHAELERVQRERNSLSAQIKEDAETMQEKLRAAQQQVVDELEQLTSRNQSLKQELESKVQEIEILTSSKDSDEKAINELQENLETLQAELAKMQLNQQQEVEAASATRIQEMECKLSEAQREHTKTVVCVRQLERQLEREKERYQKEVQEMENHYKQKLLQLEQNINTLSTDRNLLMTTLRQEGLVGKAKSMRSSPIGEEPEVPAETDTADILDELKCLTEEVLHSSDDND